MRLERAAVNDATRAAVNDATWAADASGVIAPESSASSDSVTCFGLCHLLPIRGLTGRCALSSDGASNAGSWDQTRRIGGSSGVKRKEAAGTAGQHSQFTCDPCLILVLLRITKRNCKAHGKTFSPCRGHGMKYCALFEIRA